MCFFYVMILLLLLREDAVPHSLLWDRVLTQEQCWCLNR